MSLTVTSFCWSTQPRSVPSTYQNADISAASSAVFGTSNFTDLWPSAWVNFWAVDAASANAAAVVNFPFAAPATNIPCGKSDGGKKAKIPSSHCGRPRAWQVKCTFGFQPPETPKASTPMVLTPLGVLTVIDLTPSRPLELLTTALLMTSKSWLFGAFSRVSMTAVTSTPLAAKSFAVRWASSLFVNIAIFLPTAAPQRLAKPRIAPASMIPGRSLFSKAIDRSVAPAHSIADLE